MIKWWELQVPVEDREIYQKIKLGEPSDLNENPALLIIDVLYSFTGTRPLPMLEAINEFPTSCGEMAWEALPHIQKVVAFCRNKDIPIIYLRPEIQDGGLFGSTTKRAADERMNVELAGKIHEMIEPKDQEVVLTKTKASAFFDTPLANYLRHLGADSVILTGCTTSGCVRATAVDAYSYGFSVFVLEEGCFDRSKFFHKNSLYELNAKYATVITTNQFCDFYK